MKQVKIENDIHKKIKLLATEKDQKLQDYLDDFLRDIFITEREKNNAK